MASLAAVAAAGCGGGGGGSAPAVPGAAPSSAAPSASPAASAIVGTAIDFASGVSLGGFTVIVGTVPNAATCLAQQTPITMPCGVPASPLPAATTSATGAFSVAVNAPGTYMLTIAKDGTYATLHRTVVVASGTTTIGTAKISALSTDEQAWLADVNTQRATVSYPTSFGNLIVDEYAEEQARQWASDVLAGKTVFGDAGYAPYQAAYASSPGSLYGAAGTLDEDVLGQPSAFVGSDNAWMNEKANCPNGNWETCVRTEMTGHYINISNTDTVWIGLGESWNATNPSAQYSYYDLMLIENGGSAGPQQSSKAIVMPSGGSRSEP